MFFFQAEDGIRDLTVTGVQTCALPILAQGLPDRHAKFGVNSLAARPIATLSRINFTGSCGTDLALLSGGAFCAKKIPGLCLVHAGAGIPWSNALILSPCSPAFPLSSVRC